MADWDEFSRQYDGIFTEDPVYSGMLRQMGELIGVTGARRVLDLGCGTGNLTGLVLERLPEATVLAVDPSEGMRQTCAERFAGDGRVEVVEGGGAGIPAPDGELDLVVSSLALHHVPVEEKGDAARELARVIAPGGELLYMDVFVDVEGGPPEEAWYRDLIEKQVAWALSAMEGGAFRQMNLLLRTLPCALEQDGEYLVTAESWKTLLAGAGLTVNDLVLVQPQSCGLKILQAARG